MTIKRGNGKEFMQISISRVFVHVWVDELSISEQQQQHLEISVLARKTGHLSISFSRPKKRKEIQESPRGEIFHFFSTSSVIMGKNFVPARKTKIGSERAACMA